MTIKVQLKKTISNQYKEELEKLIFFLAVEIQDFEIIVEDMGIIGVNITAPDGTDETILSNKINAAIESRISTLFIQNPKVIWKSDHLLDEFKLNIFNEMLERNMIYEVGEGQVCFAEPMITLINSLDSKFREIAVDKFKGHEYRYPTLIPTKTLEKCGYFNSFPHMLMFVTRLHNDINVYESFIKEFNHSKNGGDCILKNCSNVDYSLPPTMCYHTYNQLQNKKMSKDNQVVTAVGKSFRYESKYHKTIERLWDFTIREIVFLGEKDFVIDSRKKFMDESFKLVNELGLMGHSEVAGDPFFCGADAAAKIFNQKMLELKYELRLNIDKDKTIAAASFNFHDKFFGESFNITHKEEDIISSGCVGFGLERFAYAFVCQHGLDSKKWSKVLDINHI